MKLLIFLAFCICFASSFRVNEIQRAGEELAEPQFPVRVSGCSCGKEPRPYCGCCAEFEYNLKEHKICSNLTFIEEEKALQFTLVLDGNCLVNETMSATNPPAFCQGLKPFAYICEKYSNMSYGDNNKWGGCLEIYGGVVIQILDLKFGCFYLPVDTEEITTEKPKLTSLVDSFKDAFKEAFVQEMKERYGGKLKKAKTQLRNAKKSGIALANILFKNRVDEGGYGIEIPDFN